MKEKGFECVLPCTNSNETPCAKQQSPRECARSCPMGAMSRDVRLFAKQTKASALFCK